MLVKGPALKTDFRSGPAPKFASNAMHGLLRAQQLFSWCKSVLDAPTVLLLLQTNGTDLVCMATVESCTDQASEIGFYLLRQYS
jgi:hypothetical protein